MQLESDVASKIDADLLTDCIVKKLLKIEVINTSVYIYSKCENIDLTKIREIISCWLDSPLLYGVVYTGSCYFHTTKTKLTINLKTRKAANNFASWLDNIYKLSDKVIIHSGAIIADVNSEDEPVLGLVAYTNWNSSCEAVGQIAYVIHYTYAGYKIVERMSISGNWNIVGYATNRKWYEFLDPLVLFSLPTFLKLKANVT
jgi:hypothetical protein